METSPTRNLPNSLGALRKPPRPLYAEIYAPTSRLFRMRRTTLMDPFGGEPTRGFDASSESLEALERFFQGGEAELELVESYTSGDLVVLVVIERQHGQVGGLAEQDLSLRVTWVFRREGSEWRQVHRHADPLVHGISLEQLAALARG